MFHLQLCERRKEPEVQYKALGLIPTLRKGKNYMKF